MIGKIVIIVIDSFGIGELPDAYRYGDEGSNTLGNMAKAMNGLELPNLQSLGLGRLGSFKGISPKADYIGSFGKMAEKSPGKDTTTGHWEMAGIILDKPFPTYPKAFPSHIIDAFEKKSGFKALGNKVASGIDIINELGPLHMETGDPIVYTSADSVFQIAAHEEVIPVEKLYELCLIAREILVGDDAVGRVIARPFVGKAGAFKRTYRRHDFSLIPPKPNLLTGMVESGLEVYAVGKINDIFAGRGITHFITTKDNKEGIDTTLELMGKDFRGLIFTNLVEFDMLFGHRNDVVGYAKALKYFDDRLKDILAELGETDILIVTADHGCDPTTASTDHSREYVPLLVTGKPVRAGVDLGIRKTFADISSTVSELFGFEFSPGESFASDIIKTGE
ncbi:MAG: phosphopentomutase [Peptococcaceae bacterium]|nr:phosphopentomutase [Peptococcaceae bacterium]